MPQSVYSDIGHIIAIGDLHGNYAGFHRILERCGIIDRSGHWCAKDTHLVQLGDILGRGGEPGKIFAMLQRLESEALQWGSRVHVLLGNHEAMSMCGLLMYNTMEEFQDLSAQNFVPSLEIVDGFEPMVDWRPMPLASDDPEVIRRAAQTASVTVTAVTVTASTVTAAEKLDKRLDMLGAREFRAALSPWGKVGAWLLEHDSAVSLNGNLFVHGGLNRAHGCQPLDALNARVRKELGSLVRPDTERDTVLRRDGPQWNRDFTLKPNDERGRELDEVLNYHGCRRMVVGHTPTSCIDPARKGQIIPMYDEKMLCIDTGIGKTYGGNLSALRLGKDDVSAVYL